MAITSTEYCEYCVEDTVHDVQVTPKGEVIRCQECGTITTDPA